jgi:hypothetical protein
MSAPEKLIALRHLLAERFPTVPNTAGGALDPGERVLATGIPALDEPVGGLPLSGVTELICTAPSCGSELVIGELLAATRAARTRVALVDGSDSFDPASFSDDLFAHLLWVRCRSTAEALQAVDLLARDANLGLVILDLRRAGEAELRRTPATQWYRIQRAVEPTDLALLVETPGPTVPSAQLRFVLDIPHGVTALETVRRHVASHLAPRLQRRRQLRHAG